MKRRHFCALGLVAGILAFSGWYAGYDRLHRVWAGVLSGQSGGGSGDGPKAADKKGAKDADDDDKKKDSGGGKGGPAAGKKADHDEAAEPAHKAGTKGKDDAKDKDDADEKEKKGDDKEKAGAKDKDDDEKDEKGGKDEKDDEKDKEKKPPSRVSHDEEGNTIIKLDAETQGRIALYIEALAAASYQPTVAALGRIQEDPSQTFTLRSPVAGYVFAPEGGEWPVVGAKVTEGTVIGLVAPRFTAAERFDLITRLVTAKAEVEQINADLTAARASLEGKKKLSGQGGVVSERVVEEVEAKVKGDEAGLARAQKTVQLLESASANDGSRATAMPLKIAREGEVLELAAQPGETVDSGQLLLRLGRFDRVMARVELPIGAAAVERVREARVSALGRDGQAAAAKVVGPAPAVHPELGGQALLLSVETGTLGLRPGMAVQADLVLEGEALSGARIPAEAIVYYSGAVWAYVQTDADHFCRRRIVDGRPMEGDQFATSEIKPGDRVVTRGAATLLSEELKSLASEEAGGD